MVLKYDSGVIKNLTVFKNVFIPVKSSYHCKQVVDFNILQLFKCNTFPKGKRYLFYMQRCSIFDLFKPPFAPFY